jgi:hypothetical protein
LLFVLTVAGAAVIAAAPRAETGPPKEIVIYYGNETTNAAAASSNYGVLLDALRAYGGKVGLDLAGAIAEDAKISPSVVGDEVKSLLNGCGRINADIAVFTNELTRNGRYLLCRAASQTVETRPFAALAPSPDAILNLTPLSRPEYFHAALASWCIVCRAAAQGDPLDAFARQSRDGVDAAGERRGCRFAAGDAATHSRLPR